MSLLPENNKVFSSSENEPKSFIFIQLSILAILIFLDNSISYKKNHKPVANLVNYSQLTSLEDKFSELPVYEDPIPEVYEDPIPEVFEVSDVQEQDAPTQPVYFLKFYGAGQKTHSRLVKVYRQAKGSLKKKIKIVLSELSKGPTLEEEKKGIISGMPSDFHFGKKIKFKNGLLHISLPLEFSEDTGKELLQDRIDQLSHSLFEFPEIKGIVIYENGKKVEFLGKDNLYIPSVITRKERKIVYL
jgi:spore germination protein GerM